MMGSPSTTNSLTQWASMQVLLFTPFFDDSFCRLSCHRVAGGLSTDNDQLGTTGADTLQWAAAVQHAEDAIKFMQAMQAHCEVRMRLFCMLPRSASMLTLALYRNQMQTYLRL